eukprot:scaffold23658_cov61-Phaeocystis_antarctica.AAC.16
MRRRLDGEDWVVSRNHLRRASQDVELPALYVPVRERKGDIERGHQRVHGGYVEGPTAGGGPFERGTSPCLARLTDHHARAARSGAAVGAG